MLFPRLHITAIDDLVVMFELTVRAEESVLNIALHLVEIILWWTGMHIHIVLLICVGG